MCTATLRELQKWTAILLELHDEYVQAYYVNNVMNMNVDIT